MARIEPGWRRQLNHRHRQNQKCGLRNGCRELDKELEAALHNHMAVMSFGGFENMHSPPACSILMVGWGGGATSIQYKLFYLEHFPPCHAAEPTKDPKRFEQQLVFDRSPFVSRANALRSEWRVKFVPRGMRLL